MIITKLHLDYWRAKHVPVWVSKIEVKKLSKFFAAYAPEPGPSIHDLINTQVKKPLGYPQDPKAKKPKDPHSLHNTISLLQLVRHNIKTGAEKRTLREYLMDLRVTGHQGGRDKWAIRWVAKIEHAETNR
jgi:hypothetical protein